MPEKRYTRGVGVVHTPFELAVGMAEALGDDGESTWLDPCVGRGVFVRALSKIGVDAERITAVDVDERPEPADSFAQTVRGTDFIAWAGETSARFSRIVGNPPYVALRHLPARLAKPAQKVKLDGHVGISLRSNYWVPFVLASLSILARGGAACFVLPAAWDYANYAKPLRERLPSVFREFFVLRSSGLLFENVQDGCIVILGRGFKEANIRAVRYEFTDSEQLIECLQQGAERGPGCPTDTLRDADPECDRRLGDVVDIRLGGVTGDKKYFLLTESRRVELGLPRASLLPVLSQARHLMASRMDGQRWNELRNRDERVWLFRPGRRALGFKAVQRYLQSGRRGACLTDSHHIRRRDKWYVTRLPQRIDGFVSGMAKSGPWISFRGMSGLNATNTLYIVKFKTRITLVEKYGIALSMLTSVSRNAIRQLGRQYPDGLVKYEPRELKRIPLPAMTVTATVAISYQHAVAALLRGEESTALAIANRFLVR